MALPSAAPLYFDRAAFTVDVKTGRFSEVGLKYLEDLNGVITTLQSALSVVPGVNLFTVATQPTLGAGDAGYLGYLTDYAHFVRWSGSIWEWFGGDGNDFIALRRAAPVGNGWQLCDGTAINRLVVGAASLTEASFTTPNLAGTPAYVKSAAAYSGSIVAATAPSVNNPANTGGAGASVSGSTDSATDSIPSAFPDNFTAAIIATTASGVSLPSNTHGHPSTTGGHSHGTSGLSVGSHTHPQSAVSANADGEPAHLGLLPYYRR